VVIVDQSARGVSRPALAGFLKRASRAAGLQGQVAVRIATNRELCALNLRFRGHKRPTDVLSFPAVSPRLGVESPGGPEPQLEGDIVISAEMAAANARRLGHSLTDELKVLILHGLLHLAGYDHETDQGEMEQRETQLRNQLRLPRTLIQRVRSGVPAGSAVNSVRRAR